MKHLLLTALVAFAMIACQTENKESAEVTDADTTNTEQVAASAEGTEVPVSPDSHVWYKGSKVVTGSHNGTVPISDGHFLVNEGELTGGEFTINIAELGNNDIEKADSKEKFIGHMKSEDFFNTAEYPTAKFVITDVADENITGNLTIKETTKEITFPADVSVDGDNVTMTADFTINRTDFDVNYGSPTKFADLARDKAIKDQVELKVEAKSTTEVAEK